MRNSNKESSAILGSGGIGSRKNRSASPSSSLSEPLTSAASDVVAEATAHSRHGAADNHEISSSSRSANGHKSSNDISSSSAAAADPFYVFRDDLEKKLECVDESLAEYLRIVHHTVREHS